MSDSKANRAKGKLELSKSKLNTLLEITNAINDNPSKEELFQLLQNILVEDLLIGKFILFTNDGVWHESLTFGISKEEVESVKIESIVKKYDTISSLNAETEGGMAKLDIVIPVIHKENALSYLLLADYEGEKIEISPIIRNLRFIQTLANIIVVALENKRLNDEYIKQIEVKKELELAQNMQQLLFPRNLPNSDVLEVQAYYLPHSEVGGDYYDVVPLQNNRYALVIADVSGKGISAAILMANFQANLRALLDATNSIEELVEKCNSKVIESVNFEKFVTLFIAVFDANAKTLTYVNAGHQPALLLQSNSIVQLDKGCTVLGMFEELPRLVSTTIELEKNSKFICFTDGLTELENEEGNQLESEGVKNLVEKEDSLSVMNSTLKDRIVSLEKIQDLPDDITFLTAEFLR